MKRQSTGTPDKPVVDEGAFQQLLSAAFVLQQHKERMQAGGAPESAFGQVLMQVVQIQEQIRNRRLDLQAAATLIARRIREMTEASGAAVGILEGNDLEYFAATGSASGELGARAPFELSVAAECLNTGLVLRCPNAETDTRLRPELCRPLRIRSLIAAPILFETEVAGVLELHFAQADSIQEQDVRACQLLAALLAEAVARDKDVQPETMPPPERLAETPAPSDTASLRAALEKIKPQLERLAGSVTSAVTPPAAALPQASAASSAGVCTGCGHHLAEDESFCGVCGTSRQTQGTWASLWDLQREAEKSGKPHRDLGEDPSSEALEVLPSELEDIVAQFSMEPMEHDDVRRLKPSQVKGNGTGAQPAPLPHTPSAKAPPPDVPYSSSSYSTAHFDAESESLFPSFAAKTALSETNQSESETKLAAANAPSPTSDPRWTSAANTRAWLESEHGSWLTRKWQTQRANIYVAASAGLLLAVLLGWGTPPAPPASAGNGPPATSKSARRKAPPKPELSASEKLLVDLGLAEAPAAPAYAGDPDSRVWIDVHTALYYCPGSDLYGKTAGGRFTSQGDAQRDNFQPASRHACE